MSLRWRLILILLPLTIVSFVIINQLEGENRAADTGNAAPIADFTMTGVDTLNMDANGNPETRLTAAAMTHFEQRGETELTQPKLELFRAGQPPLYVRADQGWVTSANEVILLKGHVRFWEPGSGDEPALEIVTSKAHIYPERDMAETDQAATLTTPGSVTKTVGMRAWLNEGRIEMLSQVQTVIEQGKASIDPSP